MLSVCGVNAGQHLLSTVVGKKSLVSLCSFLSFLHIYIYTKAHFTFTLKLTLYINHTTYVSGAGCAQCYIGFPGEAVDRVGGLEKGFLLLLFHIFSWSEVTQGHGWNKNLLDV